MDFITTKSSSSDVRLATRFDMITWRKFLFITKAEADLLVLNEEPYWDSDRAQALSGIKSWKDVPRRQQQLLLDRVNEGLTKEGVPQINDRVIHWRMSKVKFKTTG
ncbi:hypothetical protein M501DRAFT_1001454 [Patellaria atrata CBS 101060]|uniref:Uncharacterized protein n=1 Tax=Patellaria atrata CBS 101060 TaxID=1346257 RepID=A0A9P4S333_9PEZI|nr:hypothetical protein M501DRAFT_1001454 [Patellaria atrata CBS 101060]